MYESSQNECILTSVFLVRYSLFLLAISLTAQVTVQLGQPRLVAEGPASERRWGRWQFPTLEAGAKGEMLLFVHVEPDSAASYGKARKIYVSVD